MFIGSGITSTDCRTPVQLAQITSFPFGLLQPAPANLLDACTVRPEVPVADSRGRADVDESLLEQKFDVVHEAENSAGELGVQVTFFSSTYLCPRHTLDEPLQFRPGHFRRTRKTQRFDPP